MYSPEALILRRCYPVPVTFADLRAAWIACPYTAPTEQDARELFQWNLKEVTGAIDEVYAVVDGREMRVAIVKMVDNGSAVFARGNAHASELQVEDLLEAADRDGYWARPHEVRIDLQERPVSHGEVARAVLVGQEYAERHGGAR